MNRLDPLIQLFGSRKFIIMVVAQVGVAYPALAGKINVELAVGIGAALVGVWMGSHAYEEASKSK